MEGFSSKNLHGDFELLKLSARLQKLLPAKTWKEWRRGLTLTQSGGGRRAWGSQYELAVGEPTVPKHGSPLMGALLPIMADFDCLGNFP